LIKNNSLTPPNARDDQPRTSVPQLSLRRSVNPPGRVPLHADELAVSLPGLASGIEHVQNQNRPVLDFSSLAPKRIGRFCAV
jgi:hypothetical protein